MDINQKAFLTQNIFLLQEQKVYYVNHERKILLRKGLD